MKQILTLFIIPILFSCGENQNWINYKSKDKDYELLFPKKPLEKSQLMNSELGPIQMDMIYYEAINQETEDNLFYSVIQMDYPENFLPKNQPEKIDSFFNASIQNSVVNVHGQLTYEKIISKKNFPGREMKVLFNEGKSVMNTRFFLVENRLIMLQVMTGVNKDFNKSINYFLDSFKLL